VACWVGVVELEAWIMLVMCEWSYVIDTWPRGDSGDNGCGDWTGSDGLTGCGAGEDGGGPD
jgi:hypothetical protein